MSTDTFSSTRLKAGFRRHRPGGLVLLIAGSLIWLIFPGIASYDLAFAVTELKARHVTDWHPPVLIRLFSLLDRLGLRGTGPLFVLQMTLFWSGLGLLAKKQAQSNHNISAFALLTIGLLPPILGWMCEVVKDAQMVAAMLCATGIAVRFRTRDRGLPPLQVAGVVLLLTYATLLRSNAFFATVPLAACLMDNKHRALLAGGFIFLTAISAPLANRHVFLAEPAYAERSLMVFDIAGTTYFSERPDNVLISPAAWKVAEKNGCFHSIAWDGFSQVPECKPMWSRMQYSPIFMPWLATVSAHPLAYAAHRLMHLNMTLRFIVPLNEPRGTAQAVSTENGWGLGANPNAARKINKWEQRLQRTPLEWPIAWVGLGVCLLWSIRYQRGGAVFGDVAVALPVSALALETSFLVVSVASDTRYHLWTFVAVGVSAILVASRERRRAVFIPAASVLGAITLLGGMARMILTPHWPAWM